MADDVRVHPDPRPADLVGQPEPCVRVGVAGYLPVSVAVSERSSTRAVRAEFRVAFRAEDPGQTRLEARRLASCQRRGRDIGREHRKVSTDRPLTPR